MATTIISARLSASFLHIQMEEEEEVRRRDLERLRKRALLRRQLVLFLVILVESLLLRLITSRRRIRRSIWMNRRRSVWWERMLKDGSDADWRENIHNVTVNIQAVSKFVTFRYRILSVNTSAFC